MASKTPEIIQAHRANGETLKIVVPLSRVDVEQQPQVPAHVLAVLAFSQKVHGVRRWSEFTAFTLKRLDQQFGDEVLRRTLCALLDDIANGFKPNNPIGIFIHRVRQTSTTAELTV